MICKYYSYYPYAADDFKVKIIDNNDHFAMPFRLYEAAKCSSSKFDDPELFILACFEALDSPSARLGLSISPGDIYVDNTYNISIITTKYFYGTTNSADGIYCINNNYYVIDYLDGHIRQYNTFESAFDYICLRQIRYYAKGIDYKPVTI